MSDPLKPETPVLSREERTEQMRKTTAELAAIKVKWFGKPTFVSGSQASGGRTGRSIES